MQFNLDKVKRANQFIGLAIFLIIIINLDISKIVQIFANLNYFYFSLAIILYVPFIVIKSMRWKYLMNAVHIEYNLWDSAIIYSAATFIGSMTPGYLGDFVKIFYLKEDGHPFGKSFTSIFLDRSLDLMSMILISLAGFPLIVKLYNVNQENVFYILLYLTSLIAVLYFLAKKRKYVKMLILLVIKKMLPPHHRENMINHFREISNSLRLFSKKDIILAILLTSIAWTVNFITAYLVALSINLKMSLFYLVTCLAISSLIALVPISISGIGTRDATLVILFSLAGYNMESAIAFSMAMWILYIINVGMTLIAWLIKPINLPSIKKTA